MGVDLDEYALLLAVTFLDALRENDIDAEQVGTEHPDHVGEQFHVVFWNRALVYGLHNAPRGQRNAVEQLHAPAFVRHRIKPQVLFFQVGDHQRAFADGENGRMQFHLRAYAVFRVYEGADAARPVADYKWRIAPDDRNQMRAGGQHAVVGAGEVLLDDRGRPPRLGAEYSLREFAEVVDGKITAPRIAADIGFYHQRKSVFADETGYLPRQQENHSAGVGHAVAGEHFPPLGFGAATLANFQSVVTGAAMHVALADPAIEQRLQSSHRRALRKLSKPLRRLYNMLLVSTGRVAKLRSRCLVARARRIMQVMMKRKMSVRV